VLTLDTYAALSDLDMGSWFSPFHFRGEPMLRFEDLLSEFGGAFTYHAEVKEPVPGLTEFILALIAKHKLESRTIVTSFHFEAVLEVKEMAPALPVGWLIGAGDFHTENIAKTKAAGFDQLCPPVSELTTERVSKAHDHIAEVRAHSVRGVSDMLRVIETGCDSMTINWPDWLVHS
jgi:glycerophosphoryl diester phosphodiesterase